jgi:hypothetical protein
MTSEVQKSIEQHNADYTKNFSHGKLALPPAKGYLVGKANAVFDYIYVWSKINLPSK